jgi:uncharacterized protein
VNLRLVVLGVSLLLLGATPLPPRTDRFVYDSANVIDDVAERDLEARHRELFAQAGVALVVVTVPRLVDETIDQLAVRIGQSWGVGREGDDRGLVLALARDDRKIFVATGYGTEGYLPDGRVGALIDEHALPALQQNQFSEGIVGLATALAAASAREYGVTLTGVPAEASSRTGSRGGGIVMLVIMLVVFAFLARRHPLLAMMMLMGGSRSHGGGFGGGFGSGGFAGGGFGGGGAGRGF